jgi:hypothetical protein
VDLLWKTTWEISFVVGSFGFGKAGSGPFVFGQYSSEIFI